MEHDFTHGQPQAEQLNANLKSGLIDNGFTTKNINQQQNFYS
jgi:hypothetical protein